MEQEKYLIKNLSLSFDGLIAYIDPADGINFADKTYFFVKRLENPSKLLQTFSIPICKDGLLICEDNLSKYEEHSDEDQLTSNPFGKHLYDGRLDRDGVTVLWSCYEDAFTITVKDGNRTKVSRNFLVRDQIIEAQKIIDTAQRFPEFDVYEFVFEVMHLGDVNV